MKRLIVHHAAGEYPVLIGRELLENLGTLLPRPAHGPMLVVTDETVAPLWLQRAQAALPHAATCILPAGETHKTLATVTRVWDRLAELGMGRDATLLALGGGVIGDMTGFAAACWMRGVSWVQLPTTLLAQVDASIGGKTAVDHTAGKNLIGAFHQPAAVIIDIATLDTLPSREFAAGFAEVVKTALLADADFLAWLEDNAAALNRKEPAALEHAIRRSCELKAAVVTADERERGRRALLNLGHTFGHAIELITGYRRFLHGEAVAIGLVLAATLSEQCAGLDPATRPRLARLLETFGLPVQVPSGLDADALLHAMRLDKKHTQAHWRLVVLEAIGAAVIRVFDSDDAIRRVLAEAAA